MRIDADTTKKFLDIIGEYRFTGGDYAVTIEGRNSSYGTLWGLMFDAFHNEHGWPFVPEHRSGSTQNIYTTLKASLKDLPGPP